MTFSDFDIATRTRDVIFQFVEQQVERIRPRIQYAVVNTIDRANLKCTVTVVGDTTPGTVKMGTIQPNAVGQVVRIDGPLGDRFISEVLGTSFISSGLTGEVVAWTGSTASIPLGLIWCNGQAVSRTAYSALFAVIGTTWGAGDGVNTFNVPDLRDRGVIGVGSLASLGQIFGSASAVASHFHGHSGTHIHGHSATHGHTVNNHNHFSPTGGDNQNHQHVFGTNGHTHVNNGGTVFMNCSATHGHAGGCGQASEAASYGGCTGFGCNITTTDPGNLAQSPTAGVTVGHTHNIPGDTPGTNGIAPGNTDSGSPGNTDSAGVTNGNYFPCGAINFLVRI